MKLGAREIGAGEPAYVIAEIGANHNGDTGLAKKMITAAAEAGCDCVKFQSWTKESLFVKSIYRPDGKPTGLEKELEDFSTSEEEFRELRAHAGKAGIDFSNTPFCRSEIDFMVDDLKSSFIKVASMDLNNNNFIKMVACKGLPVVLSTGLGDTEEIDLAVRTLRDNGNPPVALLHCVALYPPQDDQIHLRNIDMLRERYPEIPVGYSDHTPGLDMAMAAVARGASVIEKHFTLDTEMPGWDHAISSTPEEMRELVRFSRRIAKALGDHDRKVSADEKAKRVAFRRSLVTARSLAAGKVIEEEDLCAKRPGTGIEPDRATEIIGKRIKREIEADVLLCEEDF